MARHIKSGDVVMVIAGADKGRTGRVLRVLTDKNRVVVEGVSRVWKHVRPSQRNPQGGRIQKDAPIHLSNGMPLDPASGKGTRVRFEERDLKRVTEELKKRYGAPLAESRDTFARREGESRTITRIRWEKGGERAVLTAQEKRRRVDLNVWRGSFDEEIYRVR